VLNSAHKRILSLRPYLSLKNTNNKKTPQIYVFCYQGCHRARVQLLNILFCNLIRLRLLGLPAQYLNPDYSSFTKQNNVDQVKWQDVFQIKNYLTVCCNQNADGLLCFL